MILGCCLTVVLRFRSQGFIIPQAADQQNLPMILDSFPLVTANRYNSRSDSVISSRPLDLKDDDMYDLDILEKDPEVLWP